MNVRTTKDGERKMLSPKLIQLTISEFYDPTLRVHICRSKVTTIGIARNLRQLTGQFTRRSKMEVYFLHLIMNRIWKNYSKDRGQPNLQNHNCLFRPYYFNLSLKNLHCKTTFNKGLVHPTTTQGRKGRMEQTSFFFSDDPLKNQPLLE